MGVVLRKAAHAQQAVHGSGALVAINVAQLGVARGQIAIALGRVLVDEDVEGAVHGLEAIERIVKLHGRVHVGRVEAFVAGGLPEIHARNVRRVDELVAAAETLVAHPVFHDLADDGALGMPEDEAGAGELLNAEEVELFAEDAMVAARGFFKAGEVLVEIFLREERGAVDALELRIFLVAEPVGAGEAGDLEGLDAAGGGNVRAAAEIDEVAVAVEADLVAGRGELRDEVGLHEVAVACEFGESLLARLVFADEGLVAGDDFGHFGFDGGEVFGREGLLAVEVVEEAGVGCGAVAELGLGKELEDGRGENVRGGVAQDFEGVGIFFCDELEARVGGERRGEIDEARCGRVFGGVHGGLRLAVGGGVLDGARCVRHGREAGGDGGCGEARRDGVGDFERRCARGHLANGPVGQVYGDHVLAHMFGGFRCGPGTKKCGQPLRIEA